MAAPIAHIYLALQILAGPLNGQFNEKEFLIGTSFPDIRYLKLIERANTHFHKVTIEDIKKEKDSFKAGMLFHSFVDEKREEYIEQNGIYERLPKFRFTTQSLKFAEDKILRSLFDIAKYKAHFDKILPQEKNFKISDENISRWHDFLKGYFSKDISCRDLTVRYFDLHEPNSWFFKRWLVSWYYARKINSIVDDIVESEHYQDIKEKLKDFYINFITRL